MDAANSSKSHGIIPADLNFLQANCGFSGIRLSLFLIIYKILPSNKLLTLMLIILLHPAYFEPVFHYQRFRAEANAEALRHVGNI